ncbi:hypothetical protein ACFYSF_16235 [Streptomyces canus]
MKRRLATAAASCGRTASDMDSSAWNRTGWVRDDLLSDGGSLIYCGF